MRTSTTCFKYLTAHCEMRIKLPQPRKLADAAHAAIRWAVCDGLGSIANGNALWHNGSNTLWYAEVMFDPARGIIAAAATNDGRVGEMGRPIGAALVGAAQAVA